MVAIVAAVATAAAAAEASAATVLVVRPDRVNHSIAYSALDPLVRTANPSANEKQRKTSISVHDGGEVTTTLSIFRRRKEVANGAERRGGGENSLRYCAGASNYSERCALFCGFTQDF